MSDLWRNLQLGWRLCLQPLSPCALIQYPPLHAGSVTGWWLLLLDERIICYRVVRGKRRGEEGVTLSPWVWAVWCPGCVWLPVLWWDRFPGPVERKSFAASAYDLGLGIELGGGGLVLVAGWGWFLLPFLQEFLGLLFLLVLVLGLGLVGLRKCVDLLLCPFFQGLLELREVVLCLLQDRLVYLELVWCGRRGVGVRVNAWLCWFRLLVHRQLPGNGWLASVGAIST